MIRFIFLLFISLFAPFAAQAAPHKIFDAESFTLTNGLQVVVVPNHRAPVVMQMVWYKTGAADEPHGVSGIAHFMEHLMFKGTQRLPAGQFSRHIRTMGGDDNAFTSHDYTAYHETVSKDHLEDVMDMEADRMTGLLFPPADVESERSVIIEERRQRTDNDPQDYFYEHLRSVLFVNHPYGTPVLGWKQEMEKLSRDDAKSYYDAHYAPNNAILVLSGDVTAAEIRPTVERIYGVLPRRNVPARNLSGVPPLPGLATLTMHDKSIRQPVLMRLMRAPSYTQNKQDSLALQVLANILDSGSATRLYRTLVSEKKLASGVSLSYDDTALSDGLITISINPAEGVSRETVETALDDFLRDVVRNGVTRDEIHEAKERLQDQAVFARDSISGPANIFGQGLAVGMTVDDIEYWPTLIDRVTKKQIEDVATRFLNPDDYGMRPYVTGWILPEEPKAEAAP